MFRWCATRQWRRHLQHTLRPGLCPTSSAMWRPSRWCASTQGDPVVGVAAPAATSGRPHAGTATGSDQAAAPFASKPHHPSPLRVSLDAVPAVAALSRWVQASSVSELPTEWVCFLHLTNGSGGGIKEGGALLDAVGGLFEALQHRTNLPLRRLELHVTSGADASLSVDQQEVVRMATALCETIAVHAASLEAVCVPFFLEELLDHRLLHRFAASIGRCRQLRTLDVTGCRRLLTETAFLQEGLSVLDRLEELHVAHTNLDPVACGRLGDALLTSIGGWSMLRCLDVSHQRNVTERGWMQLLQNTFVGGPSQSTATRAAVPRLEDLRFDNCKLSDALLFHVAGRVGECTSLRRLDLSRNQLTAVGAAHLAVGLQGCTDLEELRMARNRKCGDGGATAITTALRKLVHLTVLDLSYCGITVRSIGEVADACHALEALRTLQLEGNHVGLAAGGIDWESIAMERAMEQSGPQDLSLIAPSSKASSMVDARLAADFEMHHRDRQSGRRRHEGRRHRCDGAATDTTNAGRDASLRHPLQRFSEALCLMPALEVVSLADTALAGHEVVQVLRSVTAGGGRCAVRQLDLSFTGTTGDTVCALLGGASPMPVNLEVLLLAGCRELGDVGLAQLCERPDDRVDSPLARCSQLRRFDISGCNVTRDGWDALLCDGLGCTPLGDDSGYAIGTHPSSGFGNVTQLMLSGNRPMSSAQLLALLLTIERWMPLCQAVALHGSAVHPQHSHPDDTHVSALTSVLRRLSLRGCTIAL